MTVLIKTAGAPDALTPTIKLIAGSVDPKLFPTVTPLKAGFPKNVAEVEQIATIVSLLGLADHYPGHGRLAANTAGFPD